MYYVYEYIRLDTNEPFYVGKGKGRRWKVWNRKYNPKFTRIINKHSVAVHILRSKLTEKESFDFEKYYIDLYTFEYGYDLANLTPGGEGHPGESKRKDTGRKVICINTSKIFSNVKNAGDYYSIECSDIRKCCNYEKRFAGKINGVKIKWMYYDEYLSNLDKREEISKEEYASSKYVYENKNKKVICVTTGEIFDSIKEASQVKKLHQISACCRGKRKSCGKDDKGNKLIWRYYKED